jgi:hypothetical protein
MCPNNQADMAYQLQTIHIDAQAKVQAPIKSIAHMCVCTMLLLQLKPAPKLRSMRQSTYNPTTILQTLLLNIFAVALDQTLIALESLFTPARLDVRNGSLQFVLQLYWCCRSFRDGRDDRVGTSGDSLYGCRCAVSLW